ncbi:trypsin-like peptidase domain-containing protein [Cronbergia sp. UHCC 0137]|uniref:trypsin-like peptidase domain-containing protein n=1 Tax=Cronbergia sp. UHCC 0137 TaxID=3110239 RepID=UPI002B201CB2|nr:trypsin-like peptidase domain-containing protein [Cronbergia sp. UHCC 0137]MEA5617390.1 trypsin-like peptidase domain-containing protein [Cronbergia sp. UHCC 0137]
MVDAKTRELYKKHIARIYTHDYEVKGSGLLIYERYIITCAHVVADALYISHSTSEKPSDLVKVDFLFPAGENKPKLAAKVLLWKPRSDCGYSYGEDIAVLELQNNFPTSYISFPLILADTTHHKFSVLGFPIGHDEGVTTEGKLVDTNGYGLVQMDVELQSKFYIEPGFSGAPVWDEIFASFVGIVVSSELDTFVELRQNVKVGYMIPAKILVENWSFLSLLQILAANTDTTMTSVIQTAYKACHPLENPPPTVATIVQDLYNLDKHNLDSQLKFKPNNHTAEFLKYLINDNNIPDYISKKLKTWGQQYIENFDSTLARNDRNNQNIKLESYIFIKIEPLTTKSRLKNPKFKISGWLIPNIQEYIDKKQKTGFHKIDFANSPDDSFTLQQIEKDFLTFFTTKINKKLESKITIVFFLSPKYLDYPVEKWKIDDFGVTCSISEKYQVIVRDVERLKQNYLNVKGNAWIEKWNKLQSITCNDFLKLHKYDAEIFSVLMNQSVGVVLNIFDENIKSCHENIFQSLTSNVIPMTICHRKQISQTDYQNRASYDLDYCISEIAENIRQKCLESFLNTTKDHLLAQDVFLISENPHILTPDSEPIITNN